MTADSFLAFLRNFRRPYASIICSTTLAGSALWGAESGHWMPEGLAWVFAVIILGDTAARMAEKIRGSSGDERAAG